MALESILKICYLVLAIFVTISSFSCISTSFILFLLVLFFGNVLLRIVFEGALLILMIYRKLTEINSKLSSPKTKEAKSEIKKVEKKEEK